MGEGGAGSQLEGGIGTGAVGGAAGAEKSANCASAGAAGCCVAAALTLAGFQRVLEPQRLQKRRTPSLVAQTSASGPESSTFSRVLQWLQTRERRPISLCAPLTGGKSISQKLRSWSKKATP